jgi:hypothetical protein
VLGYSYRLDRSQRTAMIRALLDDPVIGFENRERVVSALAAASAGKGDLAD